MWVYRATPPQAERQIVRLCKQLCLEMSKCPRKILQFVMVFSFFKYISRRKRNRLACWCKQISIAVVAEYAGEV